MKKGIIYIATLGILQLIFSCSGQFQTYDLNEEYATTIHYEQMSADDKGEEEDAKSDMVGIPGRTFYNGDLMRGAIWWGGRDVSIEKADIFIIEAENVGPDSIPFGATFPPIDLIGEPVVIKVSAFAKSDSSEAPVLYMQVADASGYQGNLNSPFYTIQKSDGFLDYYFDLRESYMQVSPKHKVNGALINSLKFYINPGQKGFTGKIYIQEVRVVPASAMEKH